MQITVHLLRNVSPTKPHERRSTSQTRTQNPPFKKTQRPRRPMTTWNERTSGGKSFDLEIPDWSRFRHYTSRRQRWIKVQTSLLSDDNYLRLTPHQRGVLQGLWLLCAKTDGRVRVSTSRLGRELGFPINTRTLEALSQAGFVRLSASDALVPEQERGSAHGVSGRPGKSGGVSRRPGKSEGTTKYRQVPESDGCS
jgi:hypothetical protein